MCRKFLNLLSFCLKKNNITLISITVTIILILLRCFIIKFYRNNSATNLIEILDDVALLVGAMVYTWTSTLSYLERGKMPRASPSSMAKPPSGESTTTECGFNYLLLSVITEVAQWGAPSCSQPQLATDNGVRNGTSNWLVAHPHPTQGSTPWAPFIAHCNAGCKSQDLLHWVSRERATSECQTNALRVRPLRVPDDL